MDDPKKKAGDLKAPLWLVPTVAMQKTANVLKGGADKYGLFNWRKSKGVKASTYISAIGRHLAQFTDGEDVDQESNESHLAHIIATCSILLDAERVGKLIDDRPRVSAGIPVILADALRRGFKKGGVVPGQSINKEGPPIEVLGWLVKCGWEMWPNCSNQFAKCGTCNKDDSEYGWSEFKMGDLSIKGQPTEEPPTKETHILGDPPCGQGIYMGCSNCRVRGVCDLCQGTRAHSGTWSNFKRL